MQVLGYNELTNNFQKHLCQDFHKAANINDWQASTAIHKATSVCLYTYTQIFVGCKCVRTRKSEWYILTYETQDLRNKLKMLLQKEL